MPFLLLQRIGTVYILRIIWGHRPIGRHQAGSLGTTGQYRVAPPIIMAIIMAMTREERNKQRSDWHKKNRDKNLESMRKYYHATSKKQSEQAKKRNELLKKEVHAQYGSVCKCCGISETIFLTVDHIEGGGNKHRTIVGSGTRFYVWLKKNGWPKGFQILCFNCNFAKHIKGFCPHNSTVGQKV